MKERNEGILRMVAGNPRMIAVSAGLENTRQDCC